MDTGRCSPIKPGEHKLPPLPYAYDALEPVIDAETLKIHHDKHHKKYVDDLNKTELALVKARNSEDYTYIKQLEGELAFNSSGHILHSIYWRIMSRPGNGFTPGTKLENWLNWCFGSYEAFKAQFLAATKAVEASGWGILGFSTAFCRLEILQCEKHQNLTQWGIIPLLVCDVWEHAYYLKYQNLRDKYVEEWWKLINWPEVEQRLMAAYNGILPLM